MNATSAYSDGEMIRLALRVAVGTRMTDLCNELGVTTTTANEIKDRWIEIALKPLTDVEADRLTTALKDEP